MGKKILTLEDLYNYYSSTSKRSRHFSAKDEDANIVVQVPGNILFEKSEDAIEGLTPVILHACHTGVNVNMSKINDSVMEAALPSFSNRPILGYIHEVDDQWEFYDHRMHVEDDEVVYDERCIGIIPESCDAKLEYDEEQDKTYVVVSGYLFDEYSHATGILEREGECSCSVELNVRELSYDAKEKVLVIENFFFSGVTILGKTPDGEEVLPGMQGANIKLADFTKQSVFSQGNMIAMLNEINAKLDQLSIQSFQRKEEDGQMTKFEELLAKYGKSVEEISFEYEGLDDEALEKAFADAFDGEGEETPDDGNEPELQKEDEENTESFEEESVEEVEETIEEESTDSVEFSVKTGDSVKTFSVSLVEKINALYTLINETYGETDNEWYDVDANEDQREVYMHGMFTGKHYKQKYSQKKDNFALQGDRVELFVKYLTEDEIKQLDSLKANFEEVSDKLNKYEAEPEKIEILNSDVYSSISESEEFSALKEKDAHFDMSVDEVRAKADEILLNAVKSGQFAFAHNDITKTDIAMKPIMSTPPMKRSRYGGLGKKED